MKNTKTVKRDILTLDDVIDRLFILSVTGNKALSKEQEGKLIKAVKNFEGIGLGEGEARFGLDKAV